MLIRKKNPQDQANKQKKPQTQHLRSLVSTHFLATTGLHGSRENILGTVLKLEIETMLFIFLAANAFVTDPLVSVTVVFLTLLSVAT